MVSRTERLKKLVEVQEQLKALHEARRAGYISAAIAAREDAADLARRSGTQSEISAVFPDLYNRGIERALARGVANDGLAEREAKMVAEVTVRTNKTEAAHRKSAAADDRERADRERLEMINRSLNKK